ASTENIKKAINILDSQQGGGGTELLSAIKRAFDLPEAGAFSRSIVVVTDGYISAEKEVFSFIRGNLNQTNVFAFGIGTSVNRYLIEGMAKAGFGELFIVTNSKEAPQAVERFLKYIQSPVLTDISVQYDGFEAYDVEPRSFPDLLAKRPIVICGKWKGDAQGSITLTGVSGTGEYNRTFTLAKIKPSESNHSLKYMWARTRIANLSDYVFVLGADERKELITLLGLTYNLLTKHTSFVAVHEVIRNRTGDSKDVIQPLPLPKGVSNRAVGGEMAKGSEPSLLLVILSLALLLSGRLLKKVYRHKKTFSRIKTGKK
ncbi:MAG: trypsin, partial [Candidatus Aminicenantes bacterium]|nr:trypsin [Candidatus Aminicenantes bacterium]